MLTFGQFGRALALSLGLAVAFLIVLRGCEKAGVPFTWIRSFPTKGAPQQSLASFVAIEVYAWQAMSFVYLPRVPRLFHV
jgi:hypothetical protein